MMEDLVPEDCSTFLMNEIEIEMMEEELAATMTTAITPCPSPVPNVGGCGSIIPDMSQEEIVCLDDTPCSDSLNGDTKDHHHHCFDTSEVPIVSIVCKWTNCDWPGSYDDLVDHIREIHVDLQPYHSLPSPKKNGHHHHRSSNCWVSSCSSSSAASTSSDDNPASVPSVTFSSDDTRSPPAPSTFRTKKPLFNVHVDTTEKYYVCLWEGCKVYGVRSQKRSWLDRHVLQHSGDKPFKCIVDKCGSRFKTQSALERHVNSHFNTTKETTSNCLNSDGSSEHGSDDLSPRTAMMRAKTCGTIMNGGSHSGTPSKLAKKKKGPRLRKQTSKGYCEDFFDTSIMDQIQVRLFQFNQTFGSHITDSLRHMTLHSKVSNYVCTDRCSNLIRLQVMGKRRIEESEESQVLLQWHPSNM